MSLLPLYLLAGSGERLRPLTDTTPKALVRINGRPILSRSIDFLCQPGHRRCAVVTGYRSEMIHDFFARDYPDVAVTYIHNDRYRQTNNAYSLWLARDLFADDGMLLLDGDILFQREIAALMTAGPEEGNRLAVRRSDDLSWEEIKVLLDGEGNIARIGKDLDPATSYGESIGIARFDREGTARLFDTLQRRMSDPNGENEFYEASFQQMIDEGTAIGIVDTMGYRCIEIDTPEDLAAAERDVAAHVDNN